MFRPSRLLRAGSAAALSLALAAFMGCGAPKTVSRIDPNATVDLSGTWNDTDSRLVSEEMVEDCLNQAWLRTHLTEREKKPAVIVGAIRNNSMEHIPTDTFINDVERSFINSGQVTVVADSGEREDLRAQPDTDHGLALFDAASGQFDFSRERRHVAAPGAAPGTAAQQDQPLVERFGLRQRDLAGKRSAIAEADAAPLEMVLDQPEELGRGVLDDMNHKRGITRRGQTRFSCFLIPMRSRLFGWNG